MTNNPKPMTRIEFLKNISYLIIQADVLEIPLICFTFYRSPEDQLKEFNAGRSQVKLGKHQQWLAMDFAIVDDLNHDGIVDKDEIRWKDDDRYTILGEYWETLGGFWGGRWKNPHDPYHFEG